MNQENDKESDCLTHDCFCRLAVLQISTSSFQFAVRHVHDKLLEFDVLWAE